MFPSYTSPDGPLVLSEVSHPLYTRQESLVIHKWFNNSRFSVSPVFHRTYLRSSVLRRKEQDSWYLSNPYWLQGPYSLPNYPDRFMMSSRFKYGGSRLRFQTPKSVTPLGWTDLVCLFGCPPSGPFHGLYSCPFSPLVRGEYEYTLVSRIPKIDGGIIESTNKRD